jgi:tetratricopeptide (TPR) repeat protein
MADKRDKAVALMHQQRFADALVLFKQLLATVADDWSLLYMAGQCCRFQNDLKGAINYLKRSVAINVQEPPILLALGIAQQLSREFIDAIESFRQAIAIDPDYVLAYNSLALTQKITGDLEHALHNYDAGVKALSRSIVKKMNNSRESDIYKHRNSRQNLWVDCATFGAIYLCSMTGGIDGLAWPTGDQAAEEERTELHAGLYWTDHRTNDNKNTRLFLPNYFNAFRETLRMDTIYSYLIGGLGTVFESLGQQTEARKHIEEAEDFSPVV